MLGWLRILRSALTAPNRHDENVLKPRDGDGFRPACLHTCWSETSDALLFSIYGSSRIIFVISTVPCRNHWWGLDTLQAGGRRPNLPPATAHIRSPRSDPGHGGAI